ncbi:MAG: aminoacetone oxidase family FAD-binding enzyme [Terracidiphilus sp.]|nr:aminoacetone oxidase family FAD-binding enzyme [Terracidiphilus sp.]
MPTPPRRYDTLILGAGAAGLFCAATAGQRGRRVAVLDHNAQPGRKILISGGGRCNFTNIHCGPANFLSQNPHFAKSALALYRPQHFLELVERAHIPWHEKTLGQLFCTRSAHDILNLLLAECDRAARHNGSVELVLSTRILSVERDPAGFRVATAQGDLLATSLVVATGGLSIPTLGATGFAYDLARQFGLTVIPPRPALVPLTLGGAEASWHALSGVSTEVIAHAGHAQFREKLLVTHRGLSGPAILQASSYWQPGEPLLIDFAPNHELLRDLLTAGARRDAAAYRQALRNTLPQRLATHLADTALPPAFTNAALAAAEHHLHHYEFHPAGTEGFAKAEVTAGGIDTGALNSRTMETRNLPGLFFIGEAVDVTGWLGGFNFQWAWSSATAAARAL